MEFAVARALKPSLRREFIFQQTLSEELLYLNGNTVVGGEDFSVDDLLDFSNGESLHYEQLQQQEHDEEKSLSSSHSLSQDSNSNSTDVSCDSIFTTELVVPAGELAELEWVSHFVDDSLPEFSLLYPVQTKVEPEPEPEPKPRACSAKKTPRFPSEMKFTTTKARTVKSRKPNPRVLSLSPLLSLPSSPPPVVYGEPPAKNQKRKAEAQGVGAQEQAQAQLQRRCSHCQVQKTPQWRTGPMGAKTLCNACGVRYKSGRLFSEYRPACSPTFRSEIHSNSHRKVLEIRKRKGMVGPDTGLAAQTQMVPTC